jgi:hypothetical protein
MRLTAEEARKLTYARLDEVVDAVLVTIEAAAKAGRRHLAAGIDYTDYPDVWITSGDAGAGDWVAVRDELTHLGYSVTFDTVNAYTLIKW